MQVKEWYCDDCDSINEGEDIIVDDIVYCENCGASHLIVENYEDVPYINKKEK